MTVSIVGASRVRLVRVCGNLSSGPKLDVACDTKFHSTVAQTVITAQTFHVRLSISTFAADNDDDRLVIHRYLFVAQSRAVGIITTVCGSRGKESERWRPYKQFNFTAFSSRLAPERLRRNIT